MSVIGNEFSGLPIADLIGGPLNAACDAQIRLATATANFINTVGFNPALDKNGKIIKGKLDPRQVDFSFWRPVPIPAIAEVLATGSVTLAYTSTAVAGLGNGTVETVLGSVAVMGVNTKFTTQLIVGSTIVVNTESKIVASIADDTHCTVASSFAATNPAGTAFNFTGGIDTLGTSVSTITVNGVELLGGSVPYRQDLESTALDVAAKINGNTGMTKYTASSNGATVRIVAPPGSGDSLNTKTITVTTSASAKLKTDPASSTMAGGIAPVAAESQVQKVVLSVPFLAIVNVPSLMIKSVNITFDMEVKSSESHKDDTSEEASLDVTAHVDFGIISADVKIHGAISAHSENTRSTDRSAKYHFDVRAEDPGMPEGLSRVLDMLQKAIAPVSTGAPTSLKDANIAQKALSK